MSHDTQVKQEAPERIWLIENNDPEATAETEILWSSAPSDAENDLNVEYLRADVVLSIIDKAGEEWSDQARARKSKTYSAYAIAALDLRGRIEAALEQASATEKEGMNG